MRQVGKFRTYLLARLNEVDELRAKVLAVEGMERDQILKHRAAPMSEGWEDLGWESWSGDGFPIGKGATPWKALGMKGDLTSGQDAVQSNC
jgi:hypothetical protein